MALGLRVIFRLGSEWEACLPLSFPASGYIPPGPEELPSLLPHAQIHQIVTSECLCPPQALCGLHTAAMIRSMVTLTEVSLFFFFLVLCIALRKCSTPHSAGSSSKGG
ncbi:hypothetical protein JOQ06_002937, partial [Pogonophryne albipinna]